MSSGRLLSLCDFEWASVATYIVYFSSVAGLAEVNSDHVISFPLGRLGPEMLLKRKERVLTVLEGNRASIERFVGDRRDDLSEDELAVIRTLYLQYKASIETVRGHIEIASVCLIDGQAGFSSSDEGEADDQLF